MIENVKKKTLRQEAYYNILHAILDGQFESGSRLDETVLANQLGISRTPVREALTRLVHEKVLVEIPYRGIFVRTFKEAEINEIYEVRKTLEVLAIRRAIRNIDENEMAELENIVNIIHNAQLNEDISAYSHWDSEFHHKIAVYSKNQTLIDMLNLIDLQIKMIRQMVNKNMNVVKRAQFERIKILNALQSRDEDSAAAFMEEHIEHVRKEAAELVEKNKASQ